MKVKLLKDIVIKAGTVFDDAPVKTERHGNHVETIIGLTKDSYGSLVYCLDDMKNLSEYFEVIEK